MGRAKSCRDMGTGGLDVLRPVERAGCGSADLHGGSGSPASSPLPTTNDADEEADCDTRAAPLPRRSVSGWFFPSLRLAF